MPRCVGDGRVPGDSGGALHLDGGYTVSKLELVRSDFTDNEARTGPAVAQFENTEEGAARVVAFVRLSFASNTLLCDEGRFLLEATNVSDSGCARAPCRVLVRDATRLTLVGITESLWPCFGSWRPRCFSLSHVARPEEGHRGALASGSTKERAMDMEISRLLPPPPSMHYIFLSSKMYRMVLE